MKISKVFPDFKKITTRCELRRTLEFIIGRATYRVEVLYCYSNPKSPWIAQAYSEKRSGGRKSIPDFPWVCENALYRCPPILRGVSASQITPQTKRG
jgi:hypothetical protein